MKQLTIHIPDNKFQFVMDMLSKLSFVKIDRPADTFVITEEQKALVNEVIRKVDEDPNYALNWEDVKHQFKVD